MDFLDLPLDVLNIILFNAVSTVSYAVVVKLRLSSTTAARVVEAFEKSRAEKLKKTAYASILDDVCPALRRDDAPYIEAWVESNPSTYRYQWERPKKGDFTDRWIRPQDSHVLAYACKVSSNPRIFECLVRLKVDPKDPCVPELTQMYRERYAELKKAGKTQDTSANNNDAVPLGRMRRPPRTGAAHQPNRHQEAEEDSNSESDSSSEDSETPTEIVNPWINMEACGAWSAIHHAIESKKHPRILLILLNQPYVDVKRGVYGIGRGERPISMAARSGSPYAVEYVRLLLERGADPNVGVVDGGVSPLHYALKYSKHSQIVELLIAHGANINDEAYDYSGDVFYCFSQVDPLHMGLKNPDVPLDSIKALVKAGASLSRTSRCYNTQFFVTRLGLVCWFMKDQRPDVIEFLLDQGVDPNEKIKAGHESSFLTLNGGNYPQKEPYSLVHHDTALHYMHKSMWGQIPSDQVVDMMLRRGASMAVKNHDEVSVAQLRAASLKGTKLTRKLSRK